MLNKFKDAVNRSTLKNRNEEDRPPPPPKPEKFCYSRPHFLGLNQDESLASRDFGLRPIMTPRDICILPLQAGYAECINGGKSDYNEDQAAATSLQLTRHFRTDIAMSCLDISLSTKLTLSDGGKASPGPGSPDLSLARRPKSAGDSSEMRNKEQQTSGSPKTNASTCQEDEVTDRVLDEDTSVPLASEVELSDFVSSTVVSTETEPSINPQSVKPSSKHDIPHDMGNHKNHIKPRFLEQCLSATYFGIFDGHAGHSVSLIVSKLLHMIVKEKLELCMSMIERIKMLEELSERGDKSPDVTVEQLVTGALEEAFINMDDLLDRERTTFHIKGGCTALVALLFDGKLYVANAGDSRAVLCQGGKVKPMSQDFTAESEKQRLNELAFNQPELLHGEFSCYEFLHRVNKLDLGKHVVCRWPGRTGWTLKTASEDDLKFPLVVGNGKRILEGGGKDILARIACLHPGVNISQPGYVAPHPGAEARIMGTIGVARCLGNHDLFVYDSDIWIKPFLSPLPEVRVFDLATVEWTENDVLIMGSDGLWDTISNEKAADIVKNTLEQPCKQQNANAMYTIAAQELVQEARGLFTGRGWRNKDDEMSSFDDITVFVIPLKHYVDTWRNDRCNSGS